MKIRYYEAKQKYRLFQKCFSWLCILFLCCSSCGRIEAVQPESISQSETSADSGGVLSGNSAAGTETPTADERAEITTLCTQFAEQNRKVFMETVVDTNKRIQMEGNGYFPVTGYPASIAEVKEDFLEIVTEAYYETGLEELVEWMYLETETGIYMLEADIPLRYGMDFETIQILSREKDKLLFTIDTDDGLITYQIELAKEDGCWKINMLHSI